MGAEKYTIDTGIYTQKRIRASGDDVAGMKEVLDELAKGLVARNESLKSLPADLDAYDRQAILIEWDTGDLAKMYADLGTEPPERYAEARTIKGHYLNPKAQPELKRQTQLTAATVQMRVKEMRMLLAAHANGDTSRELFERAIKFAIDLGRRVEELQVRQSEIYVAQVKQNTAKLRAASPKHPEAVKQKAIKMYEKLRHDKPRTKKATIEKVVREKTGVPPRTLREWLKSLATH